MCSPQSLAPPIRRLETLGFLRLVRRIPRRGAIEHFYAVAGTHDPERVVAQLAGRFLTAPETKLRTRAQEQGAKPVRLTELR